MKHRRSLSGSVMPERETPAPFGRATATFGPLPQASKHPQVCKSIWPNESFGFDKIAASRAANEACLHFGPEQTFSCSFVPGGEIVGCAGADEEEEEL
tara:strand:- start:237 stop:530 length:294 start_codon:yes stop_codon:yes gene_type:complete